MLLKAATWLGRAFRAVEIDDQVEACRRIFASNARWTVSLSAGVANGVQAQEKPDLSVDEIAAIQQIANGTVKSRLHRGRRLPHDAMQARG